MTLEPKAILAKTDEYMDQAIQFFRDIIAIQSYSSGEEKVANRIKEESCVQLMGDFTQLLDKIRITAVQYILSTALFHHIHQFLAPDGMDDRDPKPVAQTQDHPT